MRLRLVIVSNDRRIISIYDHLRESLVRKALEYAPHLHSMSDENKLASLKRVQ